MAQVAAEIRRGNVKNPNNVRVGDFIIDFEAKKSSEDTLKKSKKFWFGALKLKEN